MFESFVALVYLQNQGSGQSLRKGHSSNAIMLPYSKVLHHSSMKSGSRLTHQMPIFTSCKLDMMMRTCKHIHDANS